MTNNDILTCISKLNVAKFQLKKFLKNHYPECYKAILDKTSFLSLDENISIIERIYCIKNNIQTRQLCKVCKKNYVKFDPTKEEYRKWCSISCSCKDEATVSKSKATRLQKYGDANYHGSEKAKQTRLKNNNGCWHNEDFSEKCKKTKLERYGDENYVNKEKAEATKLELYGSQTYNNQAKIQQTKLRRHGDKNYNNREQFKVTISKFDNVKKSQIKSRRQHTNIQRYGAATPVQSQKIKDKIQHTCKTKYGVNCTLQLQKVRNAKTQEVRHKSWKHIVSETAYTPMFTENEYVENANQHIWSWRCNKCGSIFTSVYDNGMHHRCYKCYPNTTYGTSLLEQEVFEYVKSLTDVEVLSRTKANKTTIPNLELDIIIPSKNIAIEFDGLYYHSEEAGKDRQYHLKKTELCEQKGIQLIHVFEDEWLNKQKIVKSKLRHLICSKQTKIYARKCVVEKIDNNIKDKFLEKYHIQGKDISKIRYGLFYHRHLVAVMTFIKSRYSRKHQYELSRYATVSNFTIVGGAGKLLKQFETENSPSSLITYADRRWSQGKLYYKLGFDFSHNSSPNYQYVKNRIRYSRIQFQKHKLKDKLEKFDPNLSEVQNMKMNGYSRIFDCGNMVFEKLYQ